MTGLEDLGNSSTLPFRSAHLVVPGRLVRHPGQQQSWLGGTQDTEWGYRSLEGAL